ncbi:thioredoxin [Flavobacterium sp. L1I52]|uniref:Thioredoxin n=1 Tax=Flavobacterium pokkalii TaxID=1940408 RepID=A0ABR7UT71_9FLAO|nr:thioredoxin family protein [Flavobacterium pokkalii]MBD0725149.1 thioredoxin [Flavobacterium pokkalii]
MKKQIFIVLLFFWAIPSGFAQLKSYTFEEAEQLTKENPKRIVVFIHTNWCKYCKMMENSTFKNPEIISILNDNFYFVTLDAETKTDISFENHTFKFQPTGQNTGIHELATALATIDGQVVYPTLTILDSDYSILFQKHSYLKAAELITILEKTQEITIFGKNSFPNP